MLKKIKTLNEADLACKLGQLAINSKTGIISSCVEMMIESYDPKLFFFTTNMSDTSRYPKYNKCYANNGGAGLTRSQAKAAAIGESIERYSSSIYSKDELVFASYDELKPNATPPSDWVLFSEQQYKSKGFPYKPFLNDSKIFWVEGKSLITGEKVYVPATFVYLPFFTERKEEIAIAPSVSTGLSAGINIESAILGGLYEVVERDAITNMWINKLSLPTLDQFSGSTEFKKIMEKSILLDNADYHIIDITSDVGIPVAFCVKIFRSSKGMAAACGAAARLKGEDAVLKSVIEASQGAKWIQYLHLEDWLWGYQDDFSDIVEFVDHVRLYSLEENLDKLRFVYEDNTRKPINALPNYSTSNAKNDIVKCLEFIENKGMDAIVVDVTPEDVKKIGFKVVKVLVPGLQPLNGDHNYPFLGGKRLLEAPMTMNYFGGEEFNRKVFNTDPHPFP